MQHYYKLKRKRGSVGGLGVSEPHEKAHKKGHCQAERAALQDWTGTGEHAHMCMLQRRQDGMEKENATHVLPGGVA